MNSIITPIKNYKQSCFKCSHYSYERGWCNKYQCLIRSCTMGRCKDFKEKKKRRKYKTKAKRKD